MERKLACMGYVLFKNLQFLQAACLCEILCLTVNANRLTGHTSHLVENIRFKHVIELQD